MLHEVPSNTNRAALPIPLCNNNRLGYSSCSLHGFKFQAHLVNTLDPVQVAVALITLHAVQRRSNSIPKISCFVSFFVARSTVAI